MILGKTKRPRNVDSPAEARKIFAYAKAKAD